MGLNDAIDMAEKYGETAVTFELDCQTIVNAMRRRSMVRREWCFVFQSFAHQYKKLEFFNFRSKLFRGGSRITVSC
ncbi:hypothetical protein P8452_00135 [Trifolium repens]|nr:hypothetical protein P8452_00135 [Trifolium repens]